MPVINTTMQGAALTVDASGGVPSTATYSGGLALRSDGALYVAPVNPAAAAAKAMMVPEPLSKSDSRVLVDIGINSKTSLNSWTSLPTTPSAWAVTSATGTVADATGFTPAAAGNNITGRITSPVAFNSTLGAQGSIYCKVARAGISANGNNGGSSAQNTTTAWWDSVGNTFGASSFPPAVWTVQSNASTRYLSLLVNSATTCVVQDFNGSYQYIQFSLLNPSQSSPNIDPNFVEVLFTWTGTRYFLYVDGAMIRAGTLTNGALPADLFYRVTIGNGPAGPNSSLGGCLGPFKVERLQINTQFTAPSPSTLMIAVTGDSYVVGGGGFFGDGGLPNVATIATINTANANGLIDTSVAFADNAAASSTTGIVRWGRLLQAFAAKQLGVTLPFFSSSKAGHDSYFTGAHLASSARDLPTAAPPLTAYADALAAARPAILVELDSINSIIHTSAANVGNCDPVADLKWRYDYLAANNPNLRAILCVEAHSPELITAPAGLSGYAVANAVNAASVSAAFRTALRGAFYSQRYYAGGRVPVIYVTTYEQLAGSSSGATYTFGSDPRNSVTTGSAPNGPAGSAPDIHLTVRGYIKLADIVWEALKPVIQAVLPVVNADISYDGGAQSSITPNIAFGSTQFYTLNANATINAPVNAPAVGARFSLRLAQDATGTRTVTWNAAYRNAPAWTAGTAAQTAYAEFECVDHVANTWQYVGGSTAFA